MDDRSNRRLRPLLLAQGWWYVGSGLWPWASMRSFERVTGRKRDRWLVRSFGVLAAAVGIAMLADLRAGDLESARRLGLAAAVSIAATDAVHLARGETSRSLAYGGDAALEGALAALLAAMGAFERGRDGEPGRERA